MKTLLVLLFVAVALAQPPQNPIVVKYAGSTESGNTWTVPTWTYTSGTGYSCSAGAMSSPYQYFNFSFSTTNDDYFRLVAMFEDNFISSAQVFLYTHSWNPIDPCTNFIAAWDSVSGSPPIDFAGVLSAGNYDIIVTGMGSATNDAGIYAVNAIQANAYITNYDENWEWYYANTGTDCNSLDGYTAQFGTFSWVAPASWYYDVEVFGWNETYSTYPTFAIYDGNFPDPLATSPYVACDVESPGTMVVAIEGYYSDYTILESQQLTGGTNYTFVVGGYSTYYNLGIYGVFISNTRFGDTAGSPGDYAAPSVPALSTTTTCVDSGSLKEYQSWEFWAQYTTYVIDTGRESNFDTACVLYDDDNIETPPDTCDDFIMAGDTGDGGPIAVFLEPGDNYTVVITGYSSGAGVFDLWMLTGIDLGVPTGSAGTLVASFVLSFFAMLFAMM